jgi:hypothetical protein
MTSQGHPYARFRRVIERRSVAAAWATATELEQVSLADSLSLVLLVRDREPMRYPKAALRWHARYCSERPNVSLEAAMSLLALLIHLQSGDPRPPGRALRELFTARRENELANAVRQWEAWLAPTRGATACDDTSTTAAGRSPD